MKKYLHALSLMLIISFVLAGPISTVHASPQHDSVANATAEAYLLSGLRASGGVNFEGFPEEERLISGWALREALRDPQVQSNPFIYIANVTVVDDLLTTDLRISATIDFDKVVFEGDVYFSNAQLASFSTMESTFQGNVYFGNAQLTSITMKESTFRGDVHFSSAIINGYVNITNNRFEKSVYFTRAVFNGNVDLRTNVIKESLSFYGTYVAGELLLEGSEIQGTQVMEGLSHPVEFWLTQVDGVASFMNVVFLGDVNFAQSSFKRLEMVNTSFKGTADFTDASIGTTLDMTSAKFSGDATFKNLYSDNTVDFSGATFDSQADFENAHVLREADFSNVVFHGKAIFDYFTAERFIDFIGTKFDKEFSFYYTTVAWPYFDGAVFNGPVNFEGMHVSEDFELANTSYNYTKEAFQAKLMEVEGAVKFMGFSAPAGLQLSQGRFGSLRITTKDKPDIASIDLTGTDINGQFLLEKANLKKFLGEGLTVDKSATLKQVDITETLDLRSANIGQFVIEEGNIQEFIAEGLTVDESTALKQVAITKQLDLRNANIGFLKIDDQFKWPNNSSAFNLRGMTYTDIDLGDQGLTEETWYGLLTLIDQSAYTPQSYEALAQFLTEKGHPDWSAEVKLKQKRRERDEVLNPWRTTWSNGGAWLWSWFLYIFAGYGHRPVFAFVWSGLVIAVGALVFRRQENMIPVEQGDARVEYNPLWYSFALFLPYIDLGIARKWEPDPCYKWIRNYKYVHMILGWVLAPIALLTFSGIIG